MSAWHQVEDDDIYFHLTETPHSLTLTRTARLPPGLTCARCVLQWTWRSANSWGFCGNGTGVRDCRYLVTGYMH